MSRQDTLSKKIQGNAREKQSKIAPTPIIVVDLEAILLSKDLHLEQILLSSDSTIDKLKRWFSTSETINSHRNSQIANSQDLPYNLLAYRNDLIEFLRQQKFAGRTIVLVSNHKKSFNDGVLKHLKIFDDVLTRGNAQEPTNSPAKATLISQFCGETEFTFVGTPEKNADIWRLASAAIPVSRKHPAIERDLPPIIRSFQDKKNGLQLLVKQLRIYQWVKNGLVFAPIVAAGHSFDQAHLTGAFICFLAFSFTASGVYILNDLLDLAADRQHVRKRLRPMASGYFPISFGAALAPGMFILGFAIAAYISFSLLILLIAYGLLTTLYSLYLKQIPLVDVFTLSTLYSLRIVGGGIATLVIPSIWLLSFAGCLFLSLAFLKRYVEVRAAEEGDTVLAGRGYEVGESMLLLMMGIASAYSAVLIFAIWLEVGIPPQNFSNRLWLWLIGPVFLFWLSRIWLAAFRQKVDDDPIVYAIKDRILLAFLGVAALFYALALIGVS